MGCGGSRESGGDRNERQEDEPPPPQQENGAGSSEEVSMPPLLQRRRSSISHKAAELDGSGRKVSSTYDSATICALTCHGIAPARGVSGVSSKAKINQDRGVVCWPFNSSHNQALLCIFDGHGLQGEVVSQWCMTQLPIRLEAVRDVLATNPQRALSETIIRMDKDLINHRRIGHLARGAGSTSNVLYFRGDKLWVACSGDSRAVMGQQRRGEIAALDLSNDHKPDLPLERKRIEAAGGVVSAPGPRGLPPSRVWVNGRVGLAMSRSIGDGEAKGFGVVPDPEIKEFTLKPSHANGDGDKFVIVASDGIWEFISSQEACEVVHRHTNASEGVAELMALAEMRWRDEEGSYRDDITCICAFLPFLKEHPDDRDPNVSIDSNMLDIELGGGDDGYDDDGDDDGSQFAKRRLSIAHQGGEDDDYGS